jgi:hypothetical protein
MNWFKEMKRAWNDEKEDDDDYLNIALTALKGGNYTSAIDYFTKVLCLEKSDTSICMRALEGRAATYERLKQWDQAQSDARNMMTRSPSSHKGYLRLGKILRLQRRTDDALRIYTVGLKKTGHPELERQIEIFKAQLSAKSISKGCDIFEMFPCELLLRILGYMDGASRVEALKLSRQSYELRAKNKTLRRAVRFTTSGSQIAKAVRSTCSRSFVNEIICTSQASWNVITKLLESKKLPQLRRLHLVGVNISRHDHGALFQYLSWEPKELKLKRCIIESTMMEMLISHAGHSNYINISDCKVTGRSYILDRQQIVGAKRFLMDVGPSSIYQQFSNSGGICAYEGSTTGYRYHFGWRVPRYLATSLEEAKLYNLELVEHIMMTATISSSILLQELSMRAPKIRSLHFIGSISDLDGILTIISTTMPYVTEIGIHVIKSAIIEPRRLIERLSSFGADKRILCLPFLNVLSPDRKRMLSQLVPNCRIIFDPELALRIANRHWKIPKRAFE